MKKFNLKDVKYMRYLDYKMNNVPKLMHRYPGTNYPRLVEFLVHLENQRATLSNSQRATEAKRFYKILWKEGLFHSCQA